MYPKAISQVSFSPQTAVDQVVTPAFTRPVTTTADQRHWTGGPEVELKLARLSRLHHCAN
jgi:hypothetical protein